MLTQHQKEQSPSCLSTEKKYKFNDVCQGDVITITSQLLLLSQASNFRAWRVISQRNI